MSDAPAAYAKLLERFGAISDLDGAASLLGWDERTMMPRSGAEGRAEQLATLAGLGHELLVSEELWELVCELEDGAAAGELGELEADTVRIARRRCERARRVPAGLRAEMAKAASLGESAWAGAREDSDLPAFLPRLERNVELCREYAACFEPHDHPYDPLLDNFEPGMPTALVRSVLDRLRDGLVPIVEAVAAQPDAVDGSLLEGRHPIDAQERAVGRILERLPLPEGAWRLDPTEHPFAVSTAYGDIRLATRYVPDDVSFALFSTLHEAGHGIYEAGVPGQLRRGPLGEPGSLGFHESQSRLWENWVGRSRPFLAAALPVLADELGGRFADADAEDLYRAANRAGPSLIRVEADEVTYNLHIALRFELELALFEGRLGVADLADAWRERTREYLGLEVPDDARGVLQDVHWAAGAFGYFPTYALGNIIAAQLWEAAEEDIGDLEGLIGRGELDPLGRWLGERVHRHGARYLPAELAQRALGGAIEPGALLRRLGSKYGELYGF